ncbi:hypothetical protein [Lysinibacillus sphaericus]|uniref:hypothetical protein n=1 Tax=Lysinibacillus sphaericus TaxID=1421 RepID=UPI0018CFDF7F|nr:hypothetical protein [Lysinibacillus sphaericus]
MDKDKFIEWIESRINGLENSTMPLNTEIDKAYIRACIKTLETAKELVIEGRFDKTI